MMQGTMENSAVTTTPDLNALNGGLRWFPLAGHRRKNEGNKGCRGCEGCSGRNPTMMHTREKEEGDGGRQPLAAALVA